MEKIDYTLLRNYIESINSLYPFKYNSSFNSLHEGIGTCMLLNYYLGCLFEDDSLLIKSNQLYEWSIAKANEGNIKNLYSFAEGLPGVCWLRVCTPL